MSQTPIYLRIVRSPGPTLTLVDLPHRLGELRLSIHGNNKAVSLAETCTKNENMVILAVIPAMEDFAEAKAMSLAKRFDPEGMRTLGVA